MLNALQPVKIPQRLYAFAIDVALVAMMKITLLNLLSQYISSILPNLNQANAAVSIDQKMTVFVFSLFPIIWTSYTTVSTYLFGSTFGSKAFSYHFIRIENGQKFDLSFLQALQRSLIMLTCIYTWGIMAAITLFNKQKSKIVTDLVENVFAVYDKQDFSTPQLHYLPMKSESSTDKDIAA